MRNKRTFFAVSGLVGALLITAALATPPARHSLPHGNLFTLWSEQIRADATVNENTVTLLVSNLNLPANHPYYVAGGRKVIGSGVMILNGVSYPLTSSANGGLSVTMPLDPWEHNFSARLVVKDQRDALIIDDSLTWSYDQP